MPVVDAAHFDCHPPYVSPAIQQLVIEDTFSDVLFGEVSLLPIFGQ